MDDPARQLVVSAVVVRHGVVRGRRRDVAQPQRQRDHDRHPHPRARAQLSPSARTHDARAYALASRPMRSPDETTILITGATDGLGRGVAERLAAEGATLHVNGRDPERLSATADAIRQSTGNDRLHTHLADLASLDEVRALAAD